MKKILVCDDEESIRSFVVINLERAGYHVTDVGTGEDALRVFDGHNGEFDVVLLDIMMPGIDGIEVCKKIRNKSSKIGIIMLSAKTHEMEKVGALMIGADDYITKPFSPAELLARVDAVFRRVRMAEVKPEEDKLIETGPFILNAKSRILTKNRVIVDLTQVEYQLVELLMNYRNIALDRNKILKDIWGENYFGDIKIVDVNIRRLRMKIEEEPSDPRYISTVWGFGYKWNV